MERRIGFSTGALAKGDFARGVELQDREGVQAIELSALRAHELAGAVKALPLINRSRFKYRSFHAPSEFGGMEDSEVVDQLGAVVDEGLPIVVHPNSIREFSPWRELGDQVLLENMDPRNGRFRTAREMRDAFDELPNARFCFDIGHARRVDSTMSVALDLLLRLRDRLAEVHISEVAFDCRHAPISTPAALAYQRMARLIDESVPIIIESVVKETRIDSEMTMVRRCLDPDAQLLQGSSSPLQGAPLTFAAP
jgi:hypothetical protein